MEKKFRFSNKPLAARILYASVIAILCITAIVVGIVSAASRNKDNVDELPPADSGNSGTGDNSGNDSTGEEEKPAPEKPLAFVSPLVGKVVLGRTVADLMKFNTLVHLLMEALPGRAVGGVEGGIVAIGTSSTPHGAVPVGAGEPCVQHYLLQTLAVFPFEISDEGIITFALGKAQALKIF